MRQLIVNVRFIERQLEGLLELSDCRFILPFRRQRLPQIVHRLDVVRLQPQCSLKRIAGRVIFSVLQLPHTGQFSSTACRQGRAGWIVLR